MNVEFLWSEANLNCRNSMKNYSQMVKDIMSLESSLQFLYYGYHWWRFDLLGMIYM
jgi:hypothetical protein